MRIYYLLISFNVDYMNYMNYSNYCCVCCLQSYQTSFLRPCSNKCRIRQNCLHLTYLHLPSDSLSRQAGSAQGPSLGDSDRGGSGCKG